MAVHELSSPSNDSAKSQLCDEYRSGWTPASSGLRGVSHFIDQFGKLDGAARADLIQVDLEQSWSHWATTVDSRVSELSAANAASLADELLEQWKALPGVQSYRELFDTPEEMFPHWAELANCEATCRDRWGDAIGAPYFEHYFKVATEGFARRQRRHLRCEFESNENYSQVLFPMRGRNEIGRQRRKDKDPYFCEVNPDGNRLVVADRYESVVSREQLTLQILTPAVAIIINRSTVNSVRLGADMVLVPNAKACALFPFTLQIPGRKLFCY